MKDAPTFNPLHAYTNWVTSTPGVWPEEALAVTRRAIIDVVACMLPGSREPVVDKVYGVVSRWGDGPARVVGKPKALSAPMAALVNGTSAHAQDFDDNFDPAKAHATAVLVPALLAICDQEDLDTDALSDAYIVGLQIMGRVGQAVNPFHRSRGWHATATLGAIGAAAGCARALKLDAEQTAHAISLSTSRAAGFMSQFGTDTKPLHAGFAACGGVEAALFAKAGVTSGAEALHGPNGLRTLMVGPDVDDLAASMEGKAEHGQTVTFRDEDVGDPLHVSHHGLKVKRFPNCGSVHRALDGLLELREAHSFTAESVDHVLVRAPAAHLRNLMYTHPETPAEAKFSLEYNLAVGLLQGEVALGDFELDAIARPEALSLLSKIKKDYVEKLESEFPTEVHVTLTDGTTVSTSYEMPVGSKARPLSDEQILQKFDGCAAATKGLANATQIKDALEGLETNRPVRDLTRLLESE
ncbi:MAG: MmgE/PrpD family protein [Pseudomonadota bacterium]